jgi:hypothetical protein
MSTLKEDIAYALAQGCSLVDFDRYPVKLVDGVPEGRFVVVVGNIDVHAVPAAFGKPAGWRTSKLVNTCDGFAKIWERPKPEHLFPTLREAIDNAIKRFQG